MLWRLGGLRRLGLAWRSFGRRFDASATERPQAIMACVAFMRRGWNTWRCERLLPLRRQALAAALRLGLPPLRLVPPSRARSRASMARPVRSGPGPRATTWLVPFRARSRVNRLGPSHSVEPGTLMRLWLVPSPGPGAVQTALARPDSGPEPHLPPWLVPGDPGPESTA